MIGKPIGGGIPVAAYGMTAEVAARLEGPMLGHDIDVAGVGGTLSGSALAMAAVRATLSTALRQEDFDVAIPLAERFTDGIQGVIDEHDLPGTCSGSAAGRSTGSARRRAPAPRPPRPSTRSSTRSSTSGRSTGACCWRLPQHVALLAVPHRRPTSTRHTSAFRGAVEALLG